MLNNFISSFIYQSKLHRKSVPWRNTVVNYGIYEYRNWVFLTKELDNNGLVLYY